MMPSRLLLTLTVGLLAAEEALPPAPGPTPAPVTESVATDVAAPTAMPTAAPPATTSSRTITTPFAGRVVLSAGYDSNALLLEDTNQFVTDLGGPALSASALLRYRILRENDHRLEIGAIFDYDYYADQDGARQTRLGLAGTWAKRVGQWLPGASLGAYRYLVDGEATATAVSGSLSWNRPTPTWAALPSIDILWIGYDDIDVADGVQIALNYRHWFILRPGQPGSRIEASLKVGTYRADADYESYTFARPGGEIRWQDQGGGELSHWAWVGRAWYEYRSYDQAVPLTSESETAHRFHLGGEADRRLTPWLTGGAYAAYTVRNANITSREYDHFQIGLRLGATF